MTLILKSSVKTQIDSSNRKERSNLKKLLNDSTEENDNSHSKKDMSSTSKTSSTSSTENESSLSKRVKSKKKKRKSKSTDVEKTSMVTIPDTCFGGSDIHIDSTRKQAGAKSRLTTIRDTVDDDRILEPFPGEYQKKVTSSNVVTETMDDKCIADSNLPLATSADGEMNGLQASRKFVLKMQKQQQVSTPLAVKRQLQEHGLMDLTQSSGHSKANSSHEPSPIKSQPSAQTTAMTNKKAQTDQAATPVKVAR